MLPARRLWLTCVLLVMSPSALSKKLEHLSVGGQGNMIAGGTYAETLTIDPSGEQSEAQAALTKRTSWSTREPQIAWPRRSNSGKSQCSLWEPWCTNWLTERSTNTLSVWWKFGSWVKPLPAG